MDTSHVCFLGRIAGLLGDEAQAFVRLIELHRCQGHRKLVTSTVLREVELNLADPSCPVRKFASAVPLNAIDCFHALPADLPEAKRLQQLQCVSPDGTTLVHLHDRDATLVVAADGTDQDVALVTDDERLLHWQKEMVMRGEVAALPIHGLELVAEMVACKALDAETFLSAAQVEEERYDEELAHAVDWIHQTKRDRLERLTTAVAVSGWDDQ